MPPFEHAKPDVAQNGLVRVLFNVEDTSLGESEALWGEWVAPDAVRLDNIPLLIFGVSMGDVVRVARDGETVRFSGVARRGGHSTYRLMLRDADDVAIQDRLRSVVVMGCGYEQLTPKFVAVDVPPEVDIFAVYELLEDGLDHGAWTFEEGHCGHPVDTGST
jgi:hypothetical protein